MSGERMSDRVRAAARALRVFTAAELSAAVAVRTRRERELVSGHIRNFMRGGEVARGADGKYWYTPKAGRVTNRQRMWNVVRRLPQAAFGFADIELITEVKHRQVKKFCAFLVREGFVVRRARGRFARTAKKYPVTVPADPYEARHWQERKRRSACRQQ